MLSLIILGVVGLSIIVFFIFYERRKVSSKEIALIANLAAMAGLSRVPFAAIPGIQPTTALVLISGYVLGPITGFLIGALAAVSSNIFLGQGPWTIWQMVCWGLVGATGGIYKKIAGKENRVILSIVGGLWGYLFGAIMNIWHWLTFVYPLNFKSFITTYSANFWFDTLHAIGNIFFLYYLSPDLIKILQRYRRKLIIHEISVDSLDNGSKN